MHETDLLAMIEMLYSAATEPASWPVFLRRLAEVSDSEVAVVTMHDTAANEGGWLAQWGFTPEAAAEYATWAPRNPWWQAAGSLVHRGQIDTGTVIRSMPLPRPELFRSDFYNQFLRANGAHVADASAVAIFRERGVVAGVSAARAVHKPDYDADDERLLRALLPHMERAISIQRRLGLLGLEGAATAAALDRLAFAVLLLDEHGRAILHNRAAEDLFRANDGLALSRIEVPVAASPADDARLRALIAAAVATSVGRGLAAGGVLSVLRPSGRRPYSVIVAPLAMRAWPLLSRRPAAAVFVTDPEMGIVSADALRQLFALTPAEARLAAALAEGPTLEEYAAAAEITIGTARWTLKRVLEKTGCRRQSELVRLVATSVAAVVRGEVE